MEKINIALFISRIKYRGLGLIRSVFLGKELATKINEIIDHVKDLEISSGEGSVGPQGPQGPQGEIGPAGPINEESYLGAPFFMLPANNKYLSNSTGPTLGTQAGVANRITISPVLFPWDTGIDQVGISVSTQVASALVRVVIYNADPSTGRPTTLRAVSGIFDCSTAGTKTLSLNTAFEKGKVYWIGTWSSSTATLRSSTVPNCYLSWTSASSPARESSLIRTETFSDTLDPSEWAYDGVQHNNAAPHFVLLRISN